MNLKYKFIILPLFTYISVVYGQSNEPISLARIEGVVFDGIVNEAAWDAIEPFPLVQYEPNAGAPPTEKTEIRIAYDDTYIYGAIRAFDENPDGIRAPSLYRDKISGSDHFEILLDTYNDNETAYIFTTTPSGIRNDSEISNDATGGTILSGNWINKDFNTFWDVETTVTDQGWFAEIRIPFSSLRFQENNGQVIMGLTVQRKVVRKLERLVFPPIPPKTNFAFLRPSLAQKVLFKNITPSKTLYVTPYGLVGDTRSNILNTPGNAYEERNEFDKAIGADVKFSITNNLTADFTLNTDFAQAEADDQLVNLTRFSLFFPEKRQFFQERASIFDFRTGGLSRLFFSRRIGLTNDGQQVPIYGGVRMIGRMKTWDLAFLDMQTKSLNALPSENFGVLRVRKRLFNQNSYLGAMVTSRMNADGGKNMAYGIDGLIRISPDDYLTLQWAQTFDNRIANDQFSEFNSGRLALELNRRRRQGFGFTLGTILSGPNYNPGVGFVDRGDFKLGTATLSNTWLNQRGPFIWHQLELLGNTYLSNGAHETLSSELGTAWSFSRRNLDNGSVSVKHIYENLLAPLPLSGETTIPIGIYDFNRVQATYAMAGDKPLRSGLALETGSFYDGWLHTATLTPSWYLSKHFQFALRYVYNYGEFKDRGEVLNFHVARMSIGTAVNRKLSTNALIQYNSAVDLFTANVRFRYNFREGQDFWVVFNSGLNTDRRDYVPLRPSLNNQSLLVKYIHTLIFSKRKK
ncbi:MAG: carbohydrate binding family 9 domain-containing protein [Croceitalea sp.]|nr:carbohydrate binding family 9 domain-containing protein [Croceitalea sp.]